MPAPPRHEARHVIVGDDSDQFVLAKILEYDTDQRPGIRRAREMLRVLRPIARGNVLQAQRRLGLLDLRDQPPRPLALGGLYLLRFALVGGFRGPVKSMTSPVKVEMPVGRARPAVEGHGVTFRVLLATNSARSESANMRCWRFLPWPSATYFSAPEATWPLSVLIEQPSLAAACAAVLSPSGGEGRSLRSLHLTGVPGSGIACRPSTIAMMLSHWAREKVRRGARISAMHLVSQDSPAAVSSQFDQFVISGDWIMCRRLQRRCIDQVVPARSAQAGRGASFRQRRGWKATFSFWLDRFAALACANEL